MYRRTPTPSGLSNAPKTTGTDKHDVPQGIKEADPEKAQRFSLSWLQGGIHRIEMAGELLEHRDTCAESNTSNGKKFLSS